MIHCIITALKKGLFDEKRRHPWENSHMPGTASALSWELGSCWGSSGTLGKVGQGGGLRSQSLHSSQGTWERQVFILHLRSLILKTELRSAFRGHGEDKEACRRQGLDTMPTEQGHLSSHPFF